MKTFEFTLVLEIDNIPLEEIEDKLYEAGCDDALLSFRNGIAYLNFDREADDLEKAVGSAIHQAESSGLPLKVKRIEPSDLVTASEIARRLGRSKQSVQQLISGVRGDGDFPVPLAGLTSTTLIWSWQEVADWFFTKNKIDNKQICEEALIMKSWNDVLALRDNQALQESLENVKIAMNKNYNVIA
ncbi:MAG: hypothetical protein LAT75_10945 [Candidatus Cyclonatronum sp.]|uniref:helix-turn-helix transcriptional regulator n=1 Tax=Cyclonatronum sp. TaxID=3024185 RepID=UPI0025C16D94|nr:hypothetical protein [Cyclonatronum sp.]MCH8487371.1 hypothetical protein [Cyclonatronum sp.]